MARNDEGKRNGAIQTETDIAVAAGNGKKHTSNMQDLHAQGTDNPHGMQGRGNEEGKKEKKGRKEL
eukprot:1317763-Lingulodinium_polyedra.AAC.1